MKTKILAGAAILLFTNLSLVSTVSAQKEGRNKADTSAQSDSYFLSPSFGVAWGTFDGGSAWAFTSLLDSRSWWAVRLRYTSEPETLSDFGDILDGPRYPMRSAQATSLLFGPRIRTTHFYAGVLGGVSYFNGTAHGDIDSVVPFPSLFSSGIDDGREPGIYYHQVRYAGFAPSMEVALGPRWEFVSVTLSYLQIWVPGIGLNSITLGVEMSLLPFIRGVARGFEGD